MYVIRMELGGRVCFFLADDEPPVDRAPEARRYATRIEAETDASTVRITWALEPGDRIRARKV